MKTTRYQVTFIGKLSDKQKQHICITLRRTGDYAGTQILLNHTEFKELYNALVLKSYKEITYTQ